MQCSGPSVCLSVCLSHAPAQNGAFWGYGYYEILIGNPLPEVEPTGQRGRTATGPLQKHSLGGCTVDMPLSYCHRLGHIVLPRDALFHRLTEEQFQSCCVVVVVLILIRRSERHFGQHCLEVFSWVCQCLASGKPAYSDTVHFRSCIRRNGSLHKISW